MTANAMIRTVLRNVFLPLVVCVVVLAGCVDGPNPPTEPSEKAGLAGEPDAIEVPGRTESVPGRKAIIAPVPLHPVVEVLVARGDRVKKGQTIVKLDDDEPQADVRSKKAALEQARISNKEAQRHLAQAEKGYSSGALPDITYFTIRTTALKAEQDEIAAAAALDSSKAELEHYTVIAPIDGVVSYLNVCLGMVSRPGTTVWGEILDLSEIDAQCAVSPEQAERIAAGRTAQICAGKLCIPGRVVCVGIAADASTGRVPVVVRASNPDGRIRCGIPVRVRFVELGPREGGR